MKKRAGSPRTFVRGEEASRAARRNRTSHHPAGTRRRENTIPLTKVFVVCYNTLMQRTIRIQLAPSRAQADALAETSRQFAAAFNQFVQLGWHDGVANATKLHFLAYYSVRDALPDLNSNLTNTARAKAAEALRSAFTLRTQGRNVTMPQSAACPPRYNVHTYRVDWESQTVRMSLVSGRQTIRFSVPDYASKYAGYPVDTADLIERDGRWWLHVVVTVPAPEIEPTDQVVGVDLGINRPAVASNNRFLGQRRWKAVEGRYFRLTRALQKQGTKAAKRHLRKVKRRRARFRQDADHVLSKQIVGAAEPGSTIALENLKDIRKRMKANRRTKTKRRMHAWPFASLKMKIEYKAEERGCMVVAVDPRHTSQTCSCCGHTARNNRRSQSVFICRQCGYHLNADLNAARNIAAKYRAGGGISPAGGLRNQPIVSTSDSFGREEQAARL
jgi:putative transposase